MVDSGCGEKGDESLEGKARDGRFAESNIFFLSTFISCDINT